MRSCSSVCEALLTKAPWQNRHLSREAYQMTLGDPLYYLCFPHEWYPGYQRNRLAPQDSHDPTNDRETNPSFSWVLVGARIHLKGCSPLHRRRKYQPDYSRHRHQNHHFRPKIHKARRRGWGSAIRLACSRESYFRWCCPRQGRPHCYLSRKSCRRRLLALQPHWSTWVYLSFPLVYAVLLLNH